MTYKVDVVIGALVAALILFISNIVTLFAENPELTFGMIKQATWVSIGGGALVAFFKDFQARSFRRGVAALTRSGQAHTIGHWLVVPLLAVSLAVGGCGIAKPRVDSIGDGIAVASATIESAALEARTLCGNTVPGGDCLPNAAISSATRDRLREQLQSAQDLVQAADTALEAGDAVRAGDLLGRAESILLVIQTVLQERAS